MSLGASSLLTQDGEQCRQQMKCMLIFGCYNKAENHVTIRGKSWWNKQHSSQSQNQAFDMLQTFSATTRYENQGGKLWPNVIRTQEEELQHDMGAIIWCASLKISNTLGRDYSTVRMLCLASVCSRLYEHTQATLKRSAHPECCRVKKALSQLWLKK